MNTKQTQQRARNRRERFRVQSRWTKIQNSNQDLITFARLGLYNIVSESDEVSNAMRLHRKQMPIEFGDHWTTWTHNTNKYVEYQKETIAYDKLEAIEKIVYEKDDVYFTPHALQRLWERSGSGITDYQFNLGLGEIQPYLKSLYGFVNSPMLEKKELAYRCDVPLPYRGGLFLGHISIGSGGKKMIATPNNVMFEKNYQYRFCAHTWIASDQLQGNQKQIHDLLLIGEWSQAEKLVKQETWLIELFDPINQHEVLNQDLGTMISKVDTNPILAI